MLRTCGTNSIGVSSSPFLSFTATKDNLYYVSLFDLQENQILKIPAARLSAEVLLQVFGCLDNFEIRNCMLVCKGWYSQIYYEEATLQANQIYVIKALLKVNLLTQNQYFKNLHWTKKLIIIRDAYYDFERDNRKVLSIKEQINSTDKDTISNENKLEEKEFISLLSYLSKLQIFDVTDSSNCDSYLAYLHKLDSTIYIKHIVNIPCDAEGEEEEEPFDNRVMKKLLYFKAGYDFCRTLTHMTIHHCCKSTNDDLSYLQDFKCLTSLKFHNHCDYNYCDNSFTLFDLLENFPKLSNLKFTSNCLPDSDDGVNTILDEMNKEIIKGNAIGLPPSYHNCNKWN